MRWIAYWLSRKIVRAHNGFVFLMDLNPVFSNAISPPKSKMTHTAAATNRGPVNGEDFRFAASTKLIVLLSTIKLWSGAIAG